MTTPERRKHPRIDVDFVTVEIYREQLSVTELAEICPITNLSLNGMGFRSDHKFATDQLLRLTFVLPESMVIISVNANIIHFQETERRKYSYGVEFKNLGAAQKKIIQHFIQKTIDSSEQKEELSNINLEFI